MSSAAKKSSSGGRLPEEIYGGLSTTAKRSQTSTECRLEGKSVRSHFREFFVKSYPRGFNDLRRFVSAYLRDGIFYIQSEKPSNRNQVFIALNGYLYIK